MIRSYQPERRITHRVLVYIGKRAVYGLGGVALGTPFGHRRAETKASFDS